MGFEQSPVVEDVFVHCKGFSLGNLSTQNNLQFYAIILTLPSHTMLQGVTASQGLLSISAGWLWLTATARGIILPWASLLANTEVSRDLLKVVVEHVQPPRSSPQDFSWPLAVRVLPGCASTLLCVN